jgi:phenylpropionate dioxygenase-like ring-hydroxylating dioxygenase large terminal subunit
MTEMSGWQPAWELRGFSVPKGRYTSPEFAALERDKLWPHVWQMACRLEEIPRPGDYVVYEIVDQSIIVVRVDERTVKAYHNACRHRATQLATGCGHFDGGRIVCPFHGWAWKLDGACSFVLDRHEFRGGGLDLDDPELCLRECRVALWIGCVFINMDPQAPPFEAHIAPIRDYLEPLLIDRMHFYWHKRTELRANWKVAQEAFLEGYHTPGTHPQLPSRRPDGEMVHAAIHYEVFANGHSAFNHRHPDAPVSATPQSGGEDLERLIRDLSLLEEGMDAMVLAEDVELAKSLRDRGLPAGANAGAAFLDVLYENARRVRRPMPELDRDTLAKWGGECFVFPNYFVLPQFGNALIYRSRPKGQDPDTCIFEVWSVKTYPEAESPPAPFTEEVDSLDRGAWRLIPLQDFSNIPRIQKGLHSQGFEATILSERQEAGILNMHRELDRYLRAF